MKAIDNTGYIIIKIMYATKEEIEQLNDECLDLIQAGAIRFDTYKIYDPDVYGADIELRDDVEKYSISHNDAGCTLEIITADYIMMHDIESAVEVRCLI